MISAGQNTLERKRFVGRFLSNFTITFATVALLQIATVSASICPFCSAINLTFAEQIRSNDIVVIAKLVNLPDPVDDPDAELPKAEFEISQIIKGEALVKPGKKFQTLLVGRYPVGKEFLVMGVDPPNVAWSTPMKTSERVNDYLTQIQALPESGADRLAFFQQFFEDEESVLAFDAYDEFASASYEDLKALRDRMDHEQIVKWIKDPDTSVNRRRLYFTMLGVCGTPEDIEMLGGFIKSGDRKQQAGLDALVACYLTLKGEDGVDLITETFLANKEADYVDTLAAVSALRFHGTDEDLIPKAKIVGAIRHLLDRPKMADMIIPDLARWEDWSVVERLVQMFKDADDDTNWLRVPVITYLRACPKPEAKQYIEELRKIDPDAVRRADFFLDFDDDSEGWGDEEDEPDETTGDTNKESKQEKDTKEEKSEGDQKGSGNSDNSEFPLEALTYQSVSTPIQDKTSDTEPQTPVQTHRVQKPIVDGSVQQDVGMNPTPASGTSPTGTPEVEARTVAQVNPASPPVGMINPSTNWTWQIILFPMAASMIIFLLLWSIFNGWFERLIY